MTLQYITYEDNFFVSQEILDEIDRVKRDDFEKFDWQYRGKFRKNPRGQILTKYSIIPDIDLSELPFHTAKERRSYGPDLSSRFERVHGKGAVFAGMDLGYSDSPTHAVFGWYSKQKNNLLILDEYYGAHKTLDQLVTEIPARLPLLAEKYVPLWTDSAWPQSAQFLKSRGLNVQSVTKWPNSVLQGIQFLQSTNIEICERCEHTIEDFRLYAWKLDANHQPTGEPEKRHDHGVDATRYGIFSEIKNNGIGYARIGDPYMKK